MGWHEVELEVAPGIHRIEDAYTNWYLVEDGDRLTVVDTGTPRSWNSLQKVLAQIGRGTADVAAVVLTHAHFDHVGFAEKARRELGIEVWVHEDDVPLTMHPLQYGHERSRLPYVFKPGGLPVYATMGAQRAIFAPSIEAVRRFGDDAGSESLPLPGSPVPTPGHTLGHCAFWLPDRDAVIAGDAIVARDPYTGRRGPCLVSRCAVADSERNLRSLDALAATGAATVLTGHGKPLTGGAEQAVAQARTAGLS